MVLLKHIYCTIFTLIIIEYVSSDLMSSVRLLKEKIEKLGENQFTKIFNEEKMNNLYSQMYNAKMYRIIPVNESKIAERLSQQLEDELRKKMEALKKTVDFAEEQVKNYQWNPEILPADVTYINSKKLEPNDSSLVNSTLFKSKVILDKSSVHIPTEIYEGDVTILNTIKWASSLNNAFIKNVNTLRYQYFASHTGIVLQFPGMMWRNKDLDMYDVRRRPWFAQGASSPKDIMILIDTSGSMTGISLAITKVAVKRLIDTMGEDDYISVAQFPGHMKENSSHKSDPHLIGQLLTLGTNTTFTPCFTSFVQANKRNKEMLFKHIYMLKALGIADLTDALQFAIEQFKKMGEHLRPFEGTNCNRIIVVLTDGSDDHKRHEIKALMDSSPLTKNIRIFIYSIGEEVAPVDALYGITCDYRGFFGHIRSFGAVNNIIDKFISVVHTHKAHEMNPLADNEFRVFQSNVINEGFLNPKDFSSEGLGLMTSLTMPVYNRSGNGTFLGLLGTDMTVDFMNHLVPQEKLGPNGYAFAINTNGFIIFHPELKVQRGWMRDPPNVDLIEVEFNSEDKIKIRTDIINCAGSNGTGSGQMDVKSLIKVVDEIHTYEKIRKYAYHGIPLSTFGVTIVNPTFNKFYPEFHEKIKLGKLERCNNIQCVMNVILPDGTNQRIIFTNDIHIYAENGLLSQCKIFGNDVPLSFSNSESFFYASSALPEQNSSTQRMLPFSTFGSSISASISMTGNATLPSVVLGLTTSTTNQTASNKIAKFSNELIRLLIRSGDEPTDYCPNHQVGRLVVDLMILESFVKSLDTMTLEKSIKSISVAMVSGITLVYPEREKHIYKDLFPAAWNSPIFQRSFDMNKFIFYTPLHRHGPPNHNDVMIFKAFSSTPSNKEAIPNAVFGITINQSSIIDMLQSNEVCSDWRMCYLLEDGGYIVSVSDSSLVDEIGYFFGDKHVEIMKNLINNSVFLQVEEFDYQASCPRQKDPDPYSSSGRLILQVITSLPMKIIQIIAHSLATVMSIIRLSIQLLLVSQSYAQEATAANNENVSCIKIMYRYYLPDGAEQHSLIDISCDNCNFTVTTQRFENANLLLVSFDRNCTKQCTQMNSKPIPTIPVQDAGPNVCTKSLDPDYRLRPKYKCYSFDPNEDFTRCTAPRLHLSIISTTLALTIICMHALY